MKNEKELIYKKLDVLHDEGAQAYTPPDRSEKNQQIAEDFSALHAQNHAAVTTKIYKKPLFWGLATGAVSLVVVGIIVLAVLFGSANEALYYDDEDLESVTFSTLAQLQAEVSVLLPNAASYDDVTTVLFRHQETKTSVYAQVTCSDFDTGEVVELKIVLAENYLPSDEDFYASLELQGQTSLFGYQYGIFEQNGFSSAKFVYQGYRYYVQLQSDSPQNILPFIEQLERN